MSKYTTEVRFICETAAGLSESVGFDRVDEVLEKSWDKVFNFDFPLFDPGYKKALCKKILLHYYTREISDETVGLWKLHMSAKLQVIMPYYNQLYKSTLLEFNPLYDVEYWRKADRKVEGSGKNESEGSGVNRNLFSDTPQGGLQGVDSETYLSSASKDINSNKNSGSNNYDSTDDFLEHVWGKMPGVSKAKLLMEFRKSFVNVDQMIIDELSPLFFSLW